MTATTTCLRCGATTTNGLALCALCRRKASADLVFLPVYFANLARWRPASWPVRAVPGSRVLYDGTRARPGVGDRISDALDRTSTTLVGWARVLVEERLGAPARPVSLVDARLLGEVATEDEAEQVAWLCAGLEAHLTSVATCEWAGELVADLDRHEAALRELTETAVPGWYAGGCVHCQAPTYVVPGLTWVTCRRCGSTTHASDHLGAILAEARDWTARPRRLAEAVVALVDAETDVDRIYARILKWGQRGAITAQVSVETHPVTGRRYESGPRRYRLGDVLDRLAVEAPTGADGREERRVCCRVC